MALRNPDGPEGAKCKHSRLKAAGTTAITASVKNQAKLVF